MVGLKQRLAQIPLARRVVSAARAAKLDWEGGADRPPTIPDWPIDAGIPLFPGLVSQACTDSQMRTKEYRVWGEHFKVRDIYVHRKQWEWFYIAQALQKRRHRARSSRARVRRRD